MTNQDLKNIKRGQREREIAARNERGMPRGGQHHNPRNDPKSRRRNKSYKSDY